MDQGCLRGRKPHYRSFAALLSQFHVGCVGSGYLEDLTYQRPLRKLGLAVAVRGPIDILVVEDNEREQASIVSVLEASILGVRVLATCSGEEALNYLFRRNSWADRLGDEPPKLILLDLAMPGADGFSVLAKIRELEPKDALTLTPIVVFSDSNSPVDIEESYRCGANSYIIKPLNYPDFQTVVETIGNYWVRLNRRTDLN